LVAAVAAQENDRRLFDALRARRVRPQHLADARRAVRLVVLAEGLEGEYLQVGVVAARLVRVNRPAELRQDLVTQPLRVSGPVRARVVLQQARATVVGPLTVAPLVVGLGE